MQRPPGKSVTQATQAFAALATAAKAAGVAASELRVACYPEIPALDHNITRHLLKLAEVEGKTLKLIRYPRHIPDNVFGQSFIFYDELHDLDWHRRIVVRRRGKKMVYRNEIHLS